MRDDPSAGWEAAAASFAALRSPVGVDAVLRWSSHVRPGGAILDIGCGTGVPIGTALSARGFAIHGIDASPTLLDTFRRHLPDAKAACETAETGHFFDRKFDGIIAIGLMFLLDEGRQRALIARVAQCLEPGGHLLFTAPRHSCHWNDSLTGRHSHSLGWETYRRLLWQAGLEPIGHDSDEGGNDYLHASSVP